MQNMFLKKKALLISFVLIIILIISGASIVLAKTNLNSIKQAEQFLDDVTPDDNITDKSSNSVKAEPIIPENKEQQVAATQQPAKQTATVNQNKTGVYDPTLGRKSSAIYYPVIPDAKVSYLKMTYPEEGMTYPKEDLTLKWESDAPYFLLTVSDENVPSSPIFVNEILKNPGNNKISYTIPSSLLKEDGKLVIHLFGMNGTDGSDPGYKYLSIWGNGPSLYVIYIRTINPPQITYPTEKQHLPLGDVTVTWTSHVQSDLSYYVYLYDLTNNTSPYFEYGVRNDAKSFTIPQSKLMSGHEYKFKVEARFPGYNQDPKNKQFIGSSTFSIE